MPAQDNGGKRAEPLEVLLTMLGINVDDIKPGEMIKDAGKKIFGNEVVNEGLAEAVEGFGRGAAKAIRRMGPKKNLSRIEEELITEEAEFEVVDDDNIEIEGG